MACRGVSLGPRGGYFLASRKELQLRRPGCALGRRMRPTLSRVREDHRESRLLLLLALVLLLLTFLL